MSLTCRYTIPLVLGALSLSSAPPSVLLAAPGGCFASRAAAAACAGMGVMAPSHARVARLQRRFNRREG
jgi:hypothetical protein